MSSPALAPTAARHRHALDRLRHAPSSTSSRRPRRAGAAWTSAFDVCHVGVVLRALLFVHGAMAIGMVFGASTLLELARAAPPPARASRLPGVLLWLLVVCALKEPLGRAAARRAVDAAIALGALAASAPRT